MEPNPSLAMDDARVERLLDQFAVDPSDTPAFRTLEEHLFFVEAWQQLAGVYECRISTTPEGDVERERLLLRLATVLDERLENREVARLRLEELLRQNPEHAEALGRLRGLHTRAGEFGAALQLAEIEERLPLRAADRARLLAEIGTLWNHAGDPLEGDRRLEEALQLDASCDLALAERARRAAEMGRKEEALRLHALRVNSLIGAARCEVLAQMVDLLKPTQKDRIRTLLREIVRQFPDRRDSIERLIEIEREDREFERVDELQRALWKVLRDPADRLRLALEASTLQLGEAADLGAAFYWADLAQEVDSGVVAVQELRARLFRRAGQTENLIETIDSLIRIDGPTPMRLLELAVLQERGGRPERAVECLHLLLEQDPEDTEALLALDRCLTNLGRHGERAEILERRIGDTTRATDAANLLFELAELCTGPLDDEAAGEDAYRRALERTDHARAADGLKQLLAKAGRFADLATLLDQLAGREGRDEARAGILTRLGTVRLESLDDPDGARQAFSRALDADPTASEALQGLRKVATTTEDPGTQLEACQREVHLQPEPDRQLPLLREIVSVARQLGDLAQARRAAEAWAELDPSAESLRCLAELTRELVDSSGERGTLEVLEILLADDPPARAEVLVRLGELALQEPDPNALDVACHWYREALALAPDEALRSRLIELYRSSRQLPELAHQLRGRLEALTGEDAIPCRLELAEVLGDLDDARGACEVLRPGFEDDPLCAEIADALEARLLELGRAEQVCELLGRRLDGERDSERRRGIAQRLAQLLLEGRGLPADAVAVLREVADPSRDEDLEALFEQALEASSVRGERESWLRSREAHLEGERKADLLQRLATIQEEDGRRDEAIQTLRRAYRLAGEGAQDKLQSRLLALLRGHRSSREQLDLLAELLEETEDPGPRAAFLIERARIQVDDLDAPDQAIRELERAQQEAPLGAGELGLVSNLYERTGAVDQQANALGALAEATEDRQERRRALLRLAALRLEGPGSARDSSAAEASLRQILELDPADREAFDRLLALLDEDLRSRDVCELLRSRLALSELRPRERSSLALRLATLQMEEGQPEAATETVRAAREVGIERPALNELLFSALEAMGKTEDCAQLSKERARSESGVERARWLRRWLGSQKEDEDTAEERLRGLAELLREQPGDPELISLRLTLLRELGQLPELAEALDQVVSGATPLADGRRGVCLRELLQLYEGPLERPERALAWIEAEIAAEPGYRNRGAELAHRLGQSAREAALLRPLVCEAGAQPTPQCVRRLGLALWRSGDREGAEEHLRRALANDPHDLEILEALQGLVQDSDSRQLLELLEGRFPAESGDAQKALVREALEHARNTGASPLELRWLRRLQTLEPLSPQQRARWLELERADGDQASTLFALRALRETTESPGELARLLAAEAEIQLACGQLGLAHEGYAEALRLHPSPPVDWLVALEDVLKRRGEAAERVAILHELSRHPDLSPEEREDYRASRFAVLASKPELCDEAERELHGLEELTPHADPELQVARMRQLLAVYEERSRVGDWCALAERLAPLLPDAERNALERGIATRLAHPLCDVERASAAWEAILGQQPDDAEGLEALASLLRRPGSEIRLAEVLERWAECGAPDPAACWLEAGELRWRELRDAASALADAERALEIDPDSVRAHTLRSETCAQLDRAGDELASLEVLVEAVPEGPQAARHWLRRAQIASREVGGGSRAEAAASRALELDPDSAGLRTEVRRVLEGVGAWPEAAAVLRREIETTESEAKPAMLRQLAQLSWDVLHDPESTCAALEALGEHVSLRPEEYERWAEALESQQRWAEAIEQRWAGLEDAGDRAPARAWFETAQRIRERLDDPERARTACDRALEHEPDHVDALLMRAELRARLDDPLGELEDQVRLADLLSDKRAAARSAARAAHLSREHLGDRPRAQNLYRSALRHEGTLLPALLGAGELALEVGEWGEAERRLGTACSLLPDSDMPERLADAALGAATAAAQLQRHAEAFRYLELSLQRHPSNPGALDAMTDLSLRLGAYERARTCLEARIATGELEGEVRADRLLQLAQAHEGTGQLADAARTLEEVLSIRPEDEVTRARAVDLLEKIGQRERAIAQVEQWIERAAPEFVPRLELRAARLELAVGRRPEARRRLEQLTKSEGAPAPARVELAELTLADVGPEEVLPITRRGLENVKTLSERAALLWVETRALEAQGRDEDATEAACETLNAYPGNVECAQLLAGKLSLPIDRELAVTRIEGTLDTGNASPELEAELWEAIGRAYSGPLQDIERAQLCYRRALDANPQRSSTREALADTAALDPGSHRDSIRLHERLLEEFPARPGSWNAMHLIAEHWKRDRSLATSQIVLEVLGLRSTERSTGRTRVLIDTGPSTESGVCDANLLLQALAKPRTSRASAEGDAQLAPALVDELTKLTGPFWSAPDERLREIWREPMGTNRASGPRPSVRARWRLRRAMDKIDMESLRDLEPAAWRAEVLAEAAAHCFERGQLRLAELLEALLRAWPATGDLDTGAAQNLGAAIQICPPARNLLLRIARAALAGLGLS